MLALNNIRNYSSYCKVFRHLCVLQEALIGWFFPSSSYSMGAKTRTDSLSFVPSLRPPLEFGDSFSSSGAPVLGRSRGRTPVAPGLFRHLLIFERCCARGRARSGAMRAFWPKKRAAVKNVEYSLLYYHLTVVLWAWAMRPGGCSLT
jgi:hypothetical protein